VHVNGQPLDSPPEPLAYLAVTRAWADGDTVVVKLPMRLTTRTWKANQDCVSVAYGPLSFSLKIAERWERYGDRHPQWPEWEVFPPAPGTTDWCSIRKIRPGRSSWSAGTGRFPRSRSSPTPCRCRSAPRPGRSRVAAG